MTKSQRRFAAALAKVGYSTTESTTLAAPASTPASRARRAPVQVRRYAADAHPWAHDEE